MVMKFLGGFGEDDDDDIFPLESKWKSFLSLSCPPGVDCFVWSFFSNKCALEYLKLTRNKFSPAVLYIYGVVEVINGQKIAPFVFIILTYSNINVPMSLGGLTSKKGVMKYIIIEIKNFGALVALHLWLHLETR